MMTESLVLLAPDGSDDRMPRFQTRMKKSAAEPGAGTGDEKRLLNRHLTYLLGDGASGGSWVAALRL
jgi:hypothetical protein